MSRPALVDPASCRRVPALTASLEPVSPASRRRGPNRKEPSVATQSRTFTLRQIRTFDVEGELIKRCLDNWAAANFM